MYINRKKYFQNYENYAEYPHSEQQISILQ